MTGGAWRVALLLLVSGYGLACGDRSLEPAHLDTRSGEACAACRMVISDARTVGQVVSRDGEPRFFDDLGCLRTWLGQNRPGSDHVIYVADHRTGVWVPADRAVFASSSRVDTPMGSGLLAYADKASMTADSAAAPFVEVSRAHALGEAFAEGGR
jgi:copper chaperone NosL